MADLKILSTRASDIAAGEVRQQVIEDRAEVGTYVGLTVMGPRSQTQQLRHDVEEVVYFVQGKLDVTVGGLSQRAWPGQFLTIPRGSWHSFRNDSSAPARMLFVFPIHKPRTDRR